MEVDEKPNKVVRGTSEWLRYSGMAAQMGLTILAGWYIGSWIDGLLGFERPALAIALLLLFFFAYIYKLVKDLS